MFGAYIIGDEILVGKRQDKHLSFLIEALAKRGLRLSWAHYLGDEPARLAAAFAGSLRGDDIVFSFGGIGATPDDHTRQCVASAAGVPLALHPEAEREIRARFGGEVTPERLRMGEFPRGAPAVREIRPGPGPFDRSATLSALGDLTSRFESELSRRSDAQVSHAFFGRMRAPVGLRVLALHNRHHRAQLPGAALTKASA